MADYSALADKLKGLGEAVKPAKDRPARHGIDPGAFYESVKVLIDKEIQKANGELRKRGLSSIERVFVPSFQGKLCLTFGTALLCHVDLHEAKRRITAVISGPPNGTEIERKEYLMNQGATEPQASPHDRAEKLAVGYSPDRIAAEIVSGLLVEGIRLTQKRSQYFASPGESSPVAHDPRLFAEFWISLASLLRSYTAAHGLHKKRRAKVDLDEDKITVRYGSKWLHLDRIGSSIAWTRENGGMGTLELTEHGRLRGPAGEQELDMAAEAWARDLMRDQTPDQMRESKR